MPGQGGQGLISVPEWAGSMFDITPHYLTRIRPVQALPAQIAAGEVLNARMVLERSVDGQAWQPLPGANVSYVVSEVVAGGGAGIGQNGSAQTGNDGTFVIQVNGPRWAGKNIKISATYGGSV